MAEHQPAALALAMLGMFIGFVGLIVGVYLLHGTALFFLWRWFIEPIGAPALSLAWAIGIGITVGFLTNHTETAHKPAREVDSGKTFLNLTLRPALALLTGWLIQSIWGPFGG